MSSTVYYKIYGKVIFITLLKWQQICFQEIGNGPCDPGEGE